MIAFSLGTLPLISSVAVTGQNSLPSAAAIQLPGLPANPSIEDLSRAAIFEEPLTPVGGVPASVENSELAAALSDYQKRKAPDDDLAIRRFLKDRPKSRWRARRSRSILVWLAGIPADS